MLTIDAAGWLQAGPGAPALTHVPMYRTSLLDEDGPFGVTWHWTGSGADDNRGHRDSLALARWIADPRSEAKASWHVIIDRDGAVIQSAPFSVGTWHVGKLGDIRGHLRSVNRCLLGVELENLGELRPDGGQLVAWPYDAGAPRVAMTRGHPTPDGRWFDRYTPAQEQSAEALIRACVVRWGWGREAFQHAHSDFDFPRKQDPGPLWMRQVLPRVLDRIFGSRA